MKIHVRRRHIVRGERGRFTRCPIALAFEEVTGEIPRVYANTLFANDGEHRLSPTASRFIQRFDAGKPVKPFAFVLK